MWPMIALCAVSLALSAAAVGIAITCYFASRAAMKRSGTASLRAELDEIRDAFEKNSALLKRIQGRTFMQDRREAAREARSDSSVAQAPGETPDMWKARMRRDLALGKVKHQ